MTLRLILSIAEEVAQIIAESERPMARAATAAGRDVGEIAKRDGRASIAAGGFGPKWQNALRANVYPRKGDSIRAAAVVYHKVPYAIAFEEGAIIHGKPLLWLPLPTVPIGRGGRPIPASKFRQQVGTPLYTIRRPGKPPMLGAHVRTSGSKGVSLTALRRGRAPGAKGTLRPGPLYVGVEAVKMPKRFAVLDAIQRAADQLPARYVTPVQGALLQELIDVVVILNALRELRIVPRQTRADRRDSPSALPGRPSRLKSTPEKAG
jgi:hypothetical protein